MLLRKHGIALESPAPQVLEHVGALGAHEIDMAGKEVLRRRRTAAVRYEAQSRAGALLQADAAHMWIAAQSHGRGREALGILTESHDELVDVPEWQRTSADDQLWARADERDWLKILEHVVVHGVDRLARDVTRPVAETERVSVRSR